MSEKTTIEIRNVEEESEGFRRSAFAETKEIEVCIGEVVKIEIEIIPEQQVRAYGFHEAMDMGGLEELTDQQHLIGRVMICDGDGERAADEEFRVATINQFSKEINKALDDCESVYI